MKRCLMLNLQTFLNHLVRSPKQIIITRKKIYELTKSNQREKNHNKTKEKLEKQKRNKKMLNDDINGF
jgi:sRNA-binding carbon storage regulator CsrA